MRIGVGVIGFCGHAGFAVQGWDQLRACGIEVDLVAVASLDRDSIPLEHWRSFQEDFVVCDSWQDLVAHANIDVVVVDGPYHLHSEMAQAALRAGKHVFCEKSVALTWQQLADLEACYAEHSSLHFWPMMSLRYTPRFFTALELMNEGAIGELRTVRMQKSYKLGTRPEWYQDREIYGGTIPWVGSHALDLIHALAGVPKTMSAMQQMGPDNYELAASIQGQHENGVISTATLEFYRPQAADGHSDDRLRIVGDQGLIEVIGERVSIIDDQGEREIEHHEPSLPVFADGLRHILQGEKTILSAHDAFAVTKMCLAARDSADANGILVEVSND